MLFRSHGQGDIRPPPPAPGVRAVMVMEVRGGKIYVERTVRIGGHGRGPVGGPPGGGSMEGVGRGQKRLSKNLIFKRSRGNFFLKLQGGSPMVKNGLCKFDF